MTNEDGMVHDALHTQKRATVGFELENMDELSSLDDDQHMSTKVNKETPGFICKSHLRRITGKKKVK